MGGLHTEAESWSDTPPRAADGGPDVVAAFAPQGKGGGGCCQSQGNQCQVGLFVTRETS